MVAILVIASCVMEATPNIVILAPILKPLADNIGMNEIQFCVMMITALGVGFITPTAAQSLCRFRTNRRINPQNCLARHPICFLYDDRRFVDCICAGNFHNYAS